MSAEKLLLVAGEGNIPVFVAHGAKRRGIEVIPVSFTFLRPHPDLEDIHYFEKLSFQAVIEKGKQMGCTVCCLAGKFPRTVIFQPGVLGQDIHSFLQRNADWRDRPVISRVLQEFTGAGITSISPLDFIKGVLTPEGVLTRKTPTPLEIKDVRYGAQLARMLADREVGQTVVLKNQSVLAVEAAEGTTETIKRGASLAGGDVVVVKVGRSDQDFSSDVPAVGQDTVNMLASLGGGVIALEAGKSFLLERDKSVALADTGSVCLWGFTV